MAVSRVEVRWRCCCRPSSCYHCCSWGMPGFYTSECGKQGPHLWVGPVRDRAGRSPTPFARAKLQAFHPAKTAFKANGSQVLDISRAVRLAGRQVAPPPQGAEVTQSLYPSFQICCRPLPSVPRTRRRILAGYLAHHDDAHTTSARSPSSGPRADLFEHGRSQVEERIKSIYIYD